MFRYERYVFPKFADLPDGTRVEHMRDVHNHWLDLVEAAPGFKSLVEQLPFVRLNDGALVVAKQCLDPTNHVFQEFFAHMLPAPEMTPLLPLLSVLGNRVSGQ